jgi:lipid-binding SYLF domain-containing protein
VIDGTANAQSQGNDMKTLRILSAAGIALAFLCSAVTAQESVDKRIQNSDASFLEVMGAPDKGIPRGLFQKAECIVIIPDVLKAAFIVGGKYGRGFVSCRQGDSRRFGAPAAIRIEGGSYGLQIGGSATDVFMLIMNETGMRRLLGDKFTIGGEAQAAAGPVGRNASANTDVLLHAEILTWSRSRGLFAGLSLEGSTLRPDGSENQKLYGREIGNRSILAGETAVPVAATRFVADLNRYSRAIASGDDVGGSLQKSGRVTLKAVHFESGKADITPDSEAALTAAAKALQDNPAWQVRVEGFTDNVGSEDANEKLSQDRAQAVADWLASHGVDKSRLTAKGYGESRPVAKNSTPVGRRKNRRVDLVRL